ncbi:MAG: hypothetical protein V4813_14865 [Gemmatimonadota bacterium]
MSIFLCAILIGGYASDAEAQTATGKFNQFVPLPRQRALGLDALSTAQKAAVFELMMEAYALGRQQGPSDRPPVAARSAPSTTSAIESRIDGSFSGWEGETIVKLANGQIWQQTEYHYHYHYAYAPSVIVYSTGAGSFKMRVEGIDKAVGVRRLR